MGVSLEKGGRVSLSKEAPGLTRVTVALGWDPNTTDTGKDFDLDASVFVCESSSGNPRVLSDGHFVFYGNHNTPNNSVVHSGDCRTGKNGGDDETVAVDLSKLESNVDEISFIVTIHDAVGRGQNFGQVANSFIRLINTDTGAEIAKYSLEDDFSTETAVQFGSLYKKDGNWMFKAVGTGFKKGLDAFCTAYGVNLA